MNNCKYILSGLFFFMFLAGTKVAAQYENVWAFGSNAGLNFNTTPPTAIQTAMSSLEGCASVCDTSGALLFYTEGSMVWNRNGSHMPNGTNLAPVPGIAVGGTTASSSQGTVIVPMPGIPEKYYIFSLTQGEYGFHMGRLYYSVVDMSLNNGLGDVVTGQKAIFVDSMFTEIITAAVGDHCNIWLIVPSRSPIVFKAYEINQAGINTTPVVSNVGLNTSLSGWMGYLSVAPNRKQIALAQNRGALDSVAATVYNFDPATGIVTQPLVISNFRGGAYGVCFSPNSTKLYLNSSSIIYQFDLSSNDSATILLSKTPIGTFLPGALKLAPDGKIYFGASDSILGAINFPDNAGPACGLVPNAVTLLNNTLILDGLPNTVPVIRRDTTNTSTIVKAGCFATSLTLQVTNDSTSWDYLWSTGSTGLTTVADTPGTYWVGYHEPPCAFHTDTFRVIFSNGVLPSIHTSASCWNSSNGTAYAYTYAGDTVTYHYVWKNLSGDTLSLTDTLPAVASGHYNVHIATHACDTILQFYIEEDNSRVSFMADSFICLGNVVSFHNTTGSGFPLYKWNFDDGAVSVADNPVHTYTQAGTYQVRLIGKGNVCTDTAFKTLIVDPIFSGSFLTDRDSICTGESIGFLPQVDSSARSLHWQFGDGTSFTNSNEPVQHAYDKAGIMAVRLNSHFRACPDTAYTDTVYVYPMPLVNLGPDSMLCLKGAPIFLGNLQPPPDGIYQSIWNTGDTTTRIKVVHPGTFSLTIKAGPLGCSTTETIVVHKDCYIDIPNAFTPDGDGLNDYFFPRQLLSQGLTGFSMQVFNRWGQVVFETTQTDGRGWDGRFNGKAQPQGVYIYRIMAALKNGRVENYAGNVTLLR